MKEFRKTKDGLFTCEECNKTFIKFDGLSKHIGIKHGNKQNYYNKWIKEIDDNKCKLCEKTTDFYMLRHGYKKFCCKMHENIYNFEIRKGAFLLKYNVEFPWQVKKFKEKAENTCEEKYGTKYVMQNKEIKEKSKQTCKENYGVDYVLQSKEVKEKGKQTKKERYNDENYNNREKNKQTN
jgi:hypothetical protein